ncbi:uncharacterized protein ARMOST_08567 [Armillaria ostoyae]|uniref:Uncharacterized protein n=1 Tax=Armillaria ostoyae TaxID=47428 RepID=A0A284R903_ARMOS|nr:uncharacterized protein ARMOST_08567 [Armillaria ostoyae]
MTTLFIFLDNDQIYSEDGCGLVVSMSMRTSRPISAHNDELLYRGGEQTLSHKVETISSTYGFVSRSRQESEDQQLYLNRPFSYSAKQAFRSRINPQRPIFDPCHLAVESTLR